MAFLAVVMFGYAGCGPSDDTKITVYRIPKEIQPGAGAPLTPATSGETAPEVRWTAPAGWEAQPSSGFRKGSFLVRSADGKTADVSIISFPQAAGGLLANVNRWRDQLKLPPIGDPAQAGSTIKIGGRDMLFVDLVSEKPIASDGSKSRILGGILPIGDATWFFKMLGPDNLVESQRNTFQQFLESVEVAKGPGTPAPMMANTGGDSTNAPTPPLIDGPQSAPLQYKLPPNWQEKPLSPMRLASFNAMSPDGKEADVSVVTLPSIAGGDLANVNRWRGQVKLAPIDEDMLAKTAEHVRASGHDYLVVDLVSEGPIDGQEGKQRILAAILDENGRAWFIKMTGEDATVEGQKSTFTDFLRDLKIP